MAYTFPWDESFPPGTQSADQLNEDLQRVLVQTRERLVDLFGITFPNDTVTTVTATKVVLKGSATSKIIPGATSLSLRNNADSADNLLISDAGDVTIRNSLVTKGNIGGRFISVDDTSDVAQFQITISGSGGLQVKPASTATIKHLFLLDSTSNTKVDIDFQSGASTWAGLLTINAGGLTIGAGGAAIIGNTSITGSFLVNNGAGAASLEIRGAVANKRSLFYTTGGSVRWEAFTDQNAESGSNAGSNFQLSRYNDAGTFIDNAISIFRSTGVILFTSTAQSRFQLTGVNNGSMVSTLDFHASSVGVPGTYNRAGGIELQFGGGSITQFGIFADAVDLEIKSTNTANTINLLNKVSLSTTGVAAGTSVLDINKDNGASATLYIKINRAGSTKGYLGLDSGDNLCFYDSTGANKLIQIGNNGVITLGTQTGYPSTNFTDGSNTLEMGWTGNTFFIKQTQVTDRTLSFRNHSSVDILSLDYAGNKVSGNIFDATIGFRIGGAGGGGKYLRGDGTNFVSSSILAGDVPSPLNQSTFQVNSGATVSRLVTGSVAFNPGAILTGNFSTTTITVTGAQVGDAVFCNNPYLADTSEAVVCNAYVSSANTVTYVIKNTSGGTITLTNRTIKAWVIG
jgi:hypothetical protein